MIYMKDVNILIYKFTGKHFFGSVPKNWCEECDIMVATTKRVMKELGNKRIKLTIKSWWNWVPIALLRGVWHPPGLLINGKIFVQGTFPDAKKLKENLKKELKKK